MQNAFFCHNITCNIAKLGKIYIFIFSNNQSFISQLLEVIDPLGEKFGFLSSLGFHIQKGILILKP